MKEYFVVIYLLVFLYSCPAFNHLLPFCLLELWGGAKPPVPHSDETWTVTTMHGTRVRLKRKHFNVHEAVSALCPLIGIANYDPHPLP